jgi:hypothetical protein
MLGNAGEAAPLAAPQEELSTMMIELVIAFLT